MPAADPGELIPLSLLPPGELACVGELHGRADQVHRLEEMGLRCGVEIEILQGGTPCIVRLEGQKLCFRADDVTHVLVRRLARRS
jgi:ferrous iron transport protein A